MNRFLPILAGLLLPVLSLSQSPTNIEAAEWNPETGEWLVSNGSNLLSTSDGVTWSYFGDAQGSHGMEVIGGQLFTASGSTIRAYDATTAAFLGSTSIAGASFLNGMGSRAGEIFVSDFSGQRIHRVDVTDPANMVVSTLVPNTPCTPNGVTWDAGNERLLFVCWGGAADIHAVDVNSGEVSTVVDNTGLGNLDGIDGDGSGTFYVSSWSPARITRYSDNFALAETVVNSGLSSPADISFAPSEGVLGVANSGNQTLTLHNFSASALVKPVAASATCAASLEAPSNCRIASGHAGVWQAVAIDAAGRTLSTEDRVIRNFPATWTFPEGAQHTRWILTDPSGCRVVLHPAMR